MIYKVTINDKLYEVEVEEGKANLLNVEMVQAPEPKTSPPVHSADIKVPTHDIPVLATDTRPSAEGICKAPMPGVVHDIKVTRGQKISENDLLVIIEAMKMENEVFAHKSGTVAEIYAVKGATVNTGDPLILIL